MASDNKPKNKRNRGVDYSEAEIKIIRNNFLKHSKVLTSKHSNDITQKTKDNIYKDIVIF